MGWAKSLLAAEPDSMEEQELHSYHADCKGKLMKKENAEQEYTRHRGQGPGTPTVLLS